MHTPDKLSMVESSPTVRFCRWLFSWQGLRRLLILLAWLVTLIALFHGEETWRGRRAWNQYRRELIAQGDQLDFAALVPKPVPDEQNFAATPTIKSWFQKTASYDPYHPWNDSYSRVADKVQFPPRTKDASFERHFDDLVGWELAFAAARSGELTPQQQFYSAQFDTASRAKAAPAVLEGLKPNEALFAELRVASERPYSRYPVNYDVEWPYSLLLPHLSVVRGVCLRLQLKACAELAGGQSDQALADIQLVFRIADSLKTEPCLISYLVRLVCGQAATQPVWEGLAEHRWSDDQLRELETRLQQASFIADLKTSLAAEQAAGIATIELVKRKGIGYVLALNALGSPNAAPAAADANKLNFIASIIVPRGWYDQEELTYCRAFRTELATGLDTARRRISPAQVNADGRAFERIMAPTGRAESGVGRVLHHRVMATALLPALGNVVMKSAAAQTAYNQAAIACALERYHLANGQFPEKLEALEPHFISPLPHDVLTGEPYKYRLMDDGRFVLYSLGWDEKDDGGVPGRNLFDDKQGDWVWTYPAK
jgi:hypothetical protein